MAHDRRRYIVFSVLAVAAIACTASCRAMTAAPSGNAFEEKILVANRAELADGGLVDKYLINPWGIALRPPGAGGHFWISNANSFSTSTYVGDVNGQPLHQDGLKVVFFESPLLSYDDGLANVTGQVYNAASDLTGQPVEFPVSGPATDLSGPTPRPIGTISGAAKFVFVTTEGTVHAWRAGTKESMDRAVIVMDYSDHGRNQVKSLKYLSAFTGVAMTTEAGAKNRLYITDFKNGIIRVIDNTWKDITAQAPFQRPANLPEKYSPYNIQLLAGRLYVTFAVVDREGEEAGADIPGPGTGHIAVYDYDGHLVQEFDDRSRLNSPWGLAIAPKEFGAFGGALLVANFGDGTIAAFDTATGAFKDVLRKKSGDPIELEGIWGLAFGNGVSLGSTDSLYFTSAPNREQDGIFGRIRYAK
jgi:uncharacterized protein (TIGR03118 family)